MDGNEGEACESVSVTCRGLGEYEATTCIHEYFLFNVCWVMHLFSLLNAPALRHVRALLHSLCPVFMIMISCCVIKLWEIFQPASPEIVCVGKCLYYIIVLYAVYDIMCNIYTFIKEQ